MAIKKTAPMISVIIPMYNAERYIEPCLRSVLDQTFTDYELIVVDDCSTDQSVAIVKAIMPEFGDRINLIRLKKNTGNPSTPRNQALKVARGKYIAFLDNDDLLANDALEVRYNIAEEFQADIVHEEKYFSFNDGSNEINEFSLQKPPFVDKPTLLTDDIGERITEFVNKRLIWNPWDKLFRRDLIVKHKLNFASLSLFEDFAFYLTAFVNAKTIVRVPNIEYIRRYREDSPSHNPPHPFDITRNMIEVVKVLDNFMSGHDYFIRNRKFRFMVLDFFIQHRIDIVSKNIYALSETCEIDEYLRRYVFSVKPQENVALTTYLFDAANLAMLTIDKLYSENQQLKQQLAELQRRN